ncbi:MAG: [FeFe] hydrogenase H-cluster radical SAM maturase HydE [Bacteroidales bacterium]|nr:[FeFe] hydrogenase H-cluster radical SAM maturase HydE [Bacteroidales bacterium]
MDNILKTHKILKKDFLNKDDLVFLLATTGESFQALLDKAAEIKKHYVGNIVYYRGLIEYSNICSKNCFYCGIRGGNKKLDRYQMTDDEVIEAVVFAYKNNYSSIVLQGGERNDKSFINKITSLLQKINKATDNSLGITLSLGEQTEETFRIWKENGARRYLLRIEASNRDLYRKMHPDNKKHDFDTRLESLYTLKKLEYQTGTGVMIGLPFQTLEHLAQDLVFFRDFDIDMAGMGPYIEHEDTPLYQYKDLLLPRKERFELSLKMLALLRIILKDINIAATTAMQAIDPVGREKALKAGANVIMPNLTPVKYREGYLLYEDKPCTDEEAEHCMNCLESSIRMAGDDIGYGKWGDSKHYFNRINKSK